MDRAQAELDALKRTEEDLKKGHQKLEDMVSKLDQEVVRNPCICNATCCFYIYFLLTIVSYIIILHFNKVCC